MKQDELANQIAAASATFPLVPTTVQTLELAMRADASPSDLADGLLHDPLLAANLIRLANSEEFGKSRQVDSVHRAIVVIGVEAARTLILGQQVPDEPSGQTAIRQRYWKRSVYGATAAREIVDVLKLPNADELILTALLRDIGVMVLHDVAGEKYAKIAAEAPSHASLGDLEREGLGMTHGEAGAILMGSWNLPRIMLAAIEHHDAPEAVADPEERRMAMVLAVADCCADVVMRGDSKVALARVRDLFGKLVKERLAMPASHARPLPAGELPDVDSFIRRVARELQVTAKRLTEMASKHSNARHLSRANAALVRLSLDAQLRTQRLRQQAADLEFSFFEREEALKKEAATDGLTGLYNRAEFDRQILSLLALAVRHREPLSIVLIDLDRFKSVNDNFGHQAGDAVLRRVARLIDEQKRTEDSAARYGGEEMVLLLPKTGHIGASAMAERIRRAIEMSPIDLDDGTKLKDTASFGVASFEAPSLALDTEAKLISVADKALYFAKESGRNRVKVYLPTETNGDNEMCDAMTIVSEFAKAEKAKKGAADTGGEVETVEDQPLADSMRINPEPIASPLKKAVGAEVTFDCSL